MAGVEAGGGLAGGCWRRQRARSRTFCRFGRHQTPLSLSLSLTHTHTHTHARTRSPSHLSVIRHWKGRTGGCWRRQRARSRRLCRFERVPHRSCRPFRSSYPSEPPLLDRISGLLSATHTHTHTCTHMHMHTHTHTHAHTHTHTQTHTARYPCCERGTPVADAAPLATEKCSPVTVNLG